MTIDPNAAGGVAPEEIVIEDQDFSDVGNLPDGDNVDWKAEAEKFRGMATRRGTKLAKLRTKTPPTPAAPQQNSQAPKNGELGYGEKAFLNSEGYKHAEDHAYVQQTMKDTGRSLEQVLSTPYVKAELERMGEERKTKAAAPSADGGRQGAPARNSVEYWLAKGELPPASETQLRRDVVNAKMGKAKNSQDMFSKNPIVGNGRNRR